MVYRRKNGFKRVFRKKSYSTSRSKYQKLQKQIRRVAAISRPELKFLDQGIPSHTSTANTAFFTRLNDMTQGAGDSGRVGRQISNKYLSLRLSTKFLEQAASDWSANARYILFIDHQPEAGAPTWLDLFSNPTISAFRNLEKQKRYTILKQATINFETFDSSGVLQITDSSSRFINWNVKLRCKSNYNAAGNNAVSNALYFCYFADSDGVIIEQGETRLRYTDA